MTDNIFGRLAPLNSLSQSRTATELNGMVSQARRTGGVIAGWRMRKAADAGQVKMLSDVLDTYFASRREELEYRIALSLDAAKKRAIADNLETTAGIEKEISKTVSVISVELKNQVLDTSRAAIEDETKRLREMKDLLAAGNVSQARYDREVRRIQEQTDAVGDRADAVATRVIENLGERLHVALRNVERAR